MAKATQKGAAVNAGTNEADEQLVRVLEGTAVDKVLEKLEALLPAVVHEAVSEAIVHAVHAEPRAKLPKRQPQQTKETEAVKRPKAGGVCEAVWKELDKLEAKPGGHPQLQDILKVGQKKGWNPNNTRVEYYNWRKSHGISGRIASGAQPSAASA